MKGASRAYRNAFARFIRLILLRDRSLMTKLTVYSALLVVIPMSLAVFISYRESSRTLENETRRYSWQIIEQVQHYVEDYLRDYEITTLKIINHPDTVQFLKRKTLQEVNDAEMVHRVSNVLKNFAYSQSDVTNITLILDGLHSIHSAVMQEASSVEGIEKEPWYESLPPTGPPQVYSRVIEWNGRREPVLSIVKRIVNPQTLGAFGMLVIDLNYKRLHETARGIRLGERGHGYLFVTDERGRIVYHPDNTMMGRMAAPSVIHSLSEASSGSFVAELDSRKQLYTFSHSDKLDWHFITIIPYDELMSSRSYMGRTIFAAAAVFTALAFVLSLGLASSIVRPIKKLYRHMRNVEKGDFERQVRIEANDEIGMLGVGFNKMVARLAQLLEEVYFSKLRETEMHLQQRESELKMLQAQINPHFLYNSLETIRGMALERDMRDIASISAALARMLRYNVKHSSVWVSVREEVEMVNIYLQIQQFRFEDRLSYSIDLPDWVLEQSIVKLSLQPLVENSIVHGLECKDGITHIRLEAERLTEQAFGLRVCDDGPGIPQERLDRLRKQLDGERQEGSHIGLMNVHRRIRHLYGSGSGLVIESEEGAGTVVKVVLPYSMPHEEESEVG